MEAPTIPRPETTGSKPPVFDSSMFSKTENRELERTNVATAETEYRLSGSYRKGTPVRSPSDFDIDVSVVLRQRLETASIDTQILKAQFRAISEKLCEDHPSITAHCEVLGGAPRIKGTRLSVGQILGRIYTLGSIHAVVEYYSPRITEEQVKEAIAYAQDFVEIACEPLQANG